MIHDDRARRHARNHFLGYQNRRFFAGNHGGSHDDVAFGDYFAKKFALLFVELFTLRRGVAARVLRVFRFNGDFDESPAEALHLLLDRGAQIVRGDNRSESSSCSDGLQTGNAATDDEHSRWRDRSRRGGKHRKNLRKRVGGNYHGFVAGDSSHRRERVHALRPRRAGHQFDGKCGDAFRGDFLDGFERAERAKKSDQCLIGAIKGTSALPVLSFAP